jgi:hypothetical protein
METSIELTREKKGLKSVIRGSVSLRPEFSEFKDLPRLEEIRLGGKPLFEPNLSVEVTAEKGMFSTAYKVIANFYGTTPLSNRYGGKLTGWAEVSQKSVRYYDAEGNPAGAMNRARVPIGEKPRGIASGMLDDYCLGIEGNLNAVIDFVSTMPLFKVAALQVLKAVATETGDLKSVKSG